MNKKKTVVYKRRPKKKSVVSDAPAEDDAPELLPQISATKNGLNVERGSGGGAGGPVKDGEIEKDGSRKSWVDRSLSNRGRRSSLSFGEALDLSAMAFKWMDSVGSRFISDWGSKKKKQGKAEGNGTVKKANRRKIVQPSADFVQEKKAMFADIDAFELVEEEESPISRKVKHEKYAEVPRIPDLRTGRHRVGALEIVPEDGSEELDSESLSAALSAALRTPDSRRRYSTCSGGYHDSAEEDSAAPRTEVVHGWNLDDDGEGLRLISNGSDSQKTTERMFSADSRSNERRDSVDSRSGKTGGHTVDLNSLASGFRSLGVGESYCTEKQLNSLVESDPEGCSESEAEELEESLRFEELILETDLLPISEALLKECHQTRPLSLKEAISKFCDITSVVKLGEGTFGEAFKAGGCVFKIVPMDGEFMVNGEVQKTSAEIYSEVLLTSTLNRLRGVNTQASARPPNCCTNFIETKRIFICRGTYEQELIQAWEDWDAFRASDNDHPMVFPQKQLYVVFVLADGGVDLESFVLQDFNEARSILLQVVLALGVAEEGCGFEHRDLHWGNIVLARGSKTEYGLYRLLDREVRTKTFGVSVSIIDFTLSRIDTGKQVFFCNLSNDPDLFEGPTRDVQSDTYRRMLTLTEGHWEGSFPKTNCFWIHYLADILLNKKSFPSSSQEKRALRSFCKRVLLYDSAKTASSDDFFYDLKFM